MRMTARPSCSKPATPSILRAQCRTRTPCRRHRRARCSERRRSKVSVRSVRRFSVEAEQKTKKDRATTHIEKQWISNNSNSTNASVVKFGFPKGSLQQSTEDLFQRAGKHHPQMLSRGKARHKQGSSSRCQNAAISQALTMTALISCSFDLKRFRKRMLSALHTRHVLCLGAISKMDCSMLGSVAWIG